MSSRTLSRRRPAKIAKKTAAPASATPLSADAFMKAYNAQAYDEARRILEGLLERDPDWAEARIGYAQLLYEQYGEVERPLAILEDVLVASPDAPRVLTLLATIHSSLGQTDSAVDYARRCMAISPETSDAYLTVLRAHPQEGAALAERIADVMRTRPVNDRQRVVFHWTLGRIAERAGEYDLAFAEFTAANRLKPGRYDPGQMERRFANIAQSFDADTLSAQARYGLGDQKPVFILGMPRSGSTLLERILGQHPSIDTGGERTEMAKLAEDLRQRHNAPLHGQPGCADFFAALDKNEVRAAANRYLTLVRKALKNPNALRWIDKMPGNFMLVGFIEMLFPRARVIHACRDPLDTALSCYTQSFFEGHVYSQDLTALAHYLAVQRRYMAHWRSVSPSPILDIRYEDVVGDLETQARRALEHIGLAWDDACLTPQESDRAVLTASIDQVRKPIYDSSIGKWRNYERHLTPLFDAWRAMGPDVLDDMLSASADASNFAPNFHSDPPIQETDR